MKDLRKIIGLFLAIFIIGIIVAIVSINSTLNTTSIPKNQKAQDSITHIKKSI